VIEFKTKKLSQLPDGICQVFPQGQGPASVVSQVDAGCVSSPFVHPSLFLFFVYNPLIADQVLSQQ
jgi:hypothetical protein